MLILFYTGSICSAVVIFWYEVVFSSGKVVISCKGGLIQYFGTFISAIVRLKNVRQLNNSSRTSDTSCQETVSVSVIRYCTDIDTLIM